MAGLYKNTKNVRETDEEATQQAIADRINEESEQEERKRASTNVMNTVKYDKAKQTYNEEVDKGNVEFANYMGDDPFKSKEAEEAEKVMDEEEEKQESHTKRHTRRANKIAKTRAYQKAQQESDTDEEKAKKSNINDALSGSWKGKRAKDMNDEEFKEFYHALTD